MNGESIRIFLVDGKLIKREDSDVYVFSDNVAFSSPSAASACVLARNANVPGMAQGKAGKGRLGAVKRFLCD